MLLPTSLSVRAPGVRRRFGRRAGFSLAEVMIALGVVSFALLSVVGTMPAGLTTLRQAMEQTVEAQIVQRIGADISLVPFSKLDAYAAQKYYFDQDGLPLASSSEQTRFLVTLTPAAVEYPGSAAEDSGKLAGSMASFQVEIARMAGATSLSKSTYFIRVPNSGN